MVKRVRYECVFGGTSRKLLFFWEWVYVDEQDGRLCSSLLNETEEERMRSGSGSDNEEDGNNNEE